VESCPVVKVDIEEEALEFIAAGLLALGAQSPAFHRAALYALTNVRLVRQAEILGITNGSLQSYRARPDFKALARGNALKFGISVLHKIIPAACSQFGFIIQNADDGDIRKVVRVASERGGLFSGQECNLSETGYMGLLDAATDHLTRHLPSEAMYEAYGVNYLIFQSYVRPLIGYAPEVFGGRRRKYALSKIEAIKVSGAQTSTEMFFRAIKGINGEKVKDLEPCSMMANNIGLGLLALEQRR